MEVHVVREEIMKRKRYLIIYLIILFVYFDLHQVAVQLIQEEETKQPTPTPMIMTPVPEPTLPTAAPTMIPWSCDGKVSSVVPEDGIYFATTFGCWTDWMGNKYMDGRDNCVPGCLDQAKRAGLCKWNESGAECEQRVNYYTAGSARYPCLTRLLITDPIGGKAVVAVVLDSGPSCWVEHRVRKAVIDVSRPVSLYLFGTGAGWSNLITVHVDELSSDLPLGPTHSYTPVPVENTITGTAYIMRPNVRNGVNLRHLPSYNSIIKFMLKKIDDFNPQINITRLSPDGRWGYVETGYTWRNGWVYMEYLMEVINDKPK